MSSLPNSQNICTICYKTTNSKQSINRSVKITKFISFLTSLDNRHESTLFADATFTGETRSKVLESCADCEILIDSICDLYHQIKCLELKLNWKLDTLKKKVELANKIPARWTNFKTSLRLKLEGDNAKVEECQNSIGIVRKKIVESGLLQSRKSYPLVVAKRIEIQNGDLDGQQDDHASTSTGVKYQSTANVTPSVPIPVKKSLGNKLFITCEICQKKIPPKNMKQHQTTNHGTAKISHRQTHLYKCKSNGCKAYFLKKRQLSDHFLEEHIKGTTVDPEAPDIIDGVEYFRCEICKVSFPEQASLRRHVSSSKLCRPKGENGRKEEKIECGNCKETFKTNLKLWLHQNQVHSSGNRTVCPQCGKNVRKWDFNVHLQFHKSPKDWKYKCVECGKKFPTSAQLSRHRKSHAKKVKLKTNNGNNVTLDYSGSDTDEVPVDPVDVKMSAAEYRNAALVVSDPLIETKLEYSNIQVFEKDTNLSNGNDNNSFRDAVEISIKEEPDMACDDGASVSAALHSSSEIAFYSVDDGPRESVDDENCHVED